MKNSILETLCLETIFGLEPDYKTVAILPRPNDAHLLTLKFSTREGATFFLKEIDVSRTRPQTLEPIFSELEKLRRQKPRISLPLPTRQKTYHFSDPAGRQYRY